MNEFSEAEEYEQRPEAELRPRILIVDDERVIREILCEFLTLEGYDVHHVEDGECAMAELALRSYDLVISDLKMPHVSGLELLERIREANLDVLTIIMTGFGTVETAIEAMKKGAYDYLLKPFKVEEVIHIVQRALERQRLRTENIQLNEAVTLYKVSEAIATSLDLEHILNIILEAAIKEIRADVATLHLQNPHRPDLFDERIRLADDTREFKATVPSLDINEMMAHFRAGTPILAHGIRANRFFTESFQRPGLASFAAVPLRIGGRSVGTLSVYSFMKTKKFDEGKRKMLSVLASRAAASIENAQLYDDLIDKNKTLSKVNLSLEENFRQTVAGFAQALEESDQYTRGHSERVAHYSALIAQAMDMPQAEVEVVVQAGLMHDIGKIGIRYDMLNKPGKLSPAESQTIREHPDKGRRILSPIPCMCNLIDGAWCHHEWYDGGGYPRGLVGDNIPLVGRIVAVADAYDAMTSDRAYRRALPHVVATAEMSRCAGSQFDPDITEVFLHALEEFRALARDHDHSELLPP